MSIITQLSPIVVQADPSDPFPSVGPGHFVHIAGTDRLYIGQFENSSFDTVEIGGVKFGSTLIPPPGLDNRTLYHPTGTNRLYIREEDGTWVNIAGSQTSGNNDIIYYVDIVAGSDLSGNGNQDNPFQTLQYAYSLLPKSPSGPCRLMLVGEGPYVLPAELQGVTPQGANGEPLMICGVTTPVGFPGVVRAVSDDSIDINGVIAPDDWRGLIYHGLTGSSADQYYQISHNTSTQIFSIGNTFDAQIDDTFEIRRISTQLIALSDITINGPGKIGFWNCEISYNTFNVVDATVLFDACTLICTDRFYGRLQSTCQFMATSESEDFKTITDVGTQLGKVGAFFNNAVPDPVSSICMFDESLGTGYLITKGGLDGTGGHWILSGTDIDLNGVASSIGILTKAGGSLEINTGIHRIVLGPTGVGIDVLQNASAVIANATVNITEAGLTAVEVKDGGFIEMSQIAGSTGNGLGVLVLDGGMLLNYGGNTVTGTDGDALIGPSGTSIPWASVPRCSFAAPAPSTGILTDPSFYIDPTTGSDINPGTIASPFLTINHALQALTPGWYGTATINLRSGTYTVPNRISFTSPLGNNISTTGGLLFNGVDNTDSGLGARTASGGTTGTSPVFGTVVDSAGGLVVNAHRGKFIRFTSGATLNGRSFIIAKNTANTFTISGVIPVAPTTETFVVETPAANITWAGSAIWAASSANVGMQNIGIVGPGGSASLVLSSVVLGIQKCTISAIGSEGLFLRSGSSISNLSSALGFFGTLSIPEICGANFVGFPIVCSLDSGANGDLLRCVFNNCSTNLYSQVTWQVRDSYFTGDSWWLTAYGAFSAITRNVFDTVTPAPVNTDLIIDAKGAAVVFSKSSRGICTTSDISNTPATTVPGDAIFIEDASSATISTMTGSGNAGVGCRTQRSSSFRRNGSTTVTGVGGDVKLGDSAVQPWSDFSVIVADAAQLCLGGPH